MSVLVCGDRNWTDTEIPWKALACFLQIEEVVVHGGCRGADTIAGTAAERLGANVIVEPAEWKRFGRGAGPKRNQAMLDKHHPWLAIAFHDDIESSNGTRDMIDRASKADLAVILVTHDAVVAMHEPSSESLMMVARDIECKMAFTLKVDYVRPYANKRR